MRKRIATPRCVLQVAIGLLLAGCATTSVFIPYTYEAAKYKQSLVQGNTDSALATLENKTHSRDRLLYLLERGRLYQVNDQFEQSQADFAQAIDLFTAREDKARISATDLAASSTSLLTNDNAIPYRGESFERIFVHQFQAFNYLGQGDVTGANVELRRAALEQRTQELANERAIAKAEAEAREEQVRFPDVDTIPQLQGMNTLIGDVKSAFQNAYTFYTSAVIWEAQGEHNAALVDYKKALEINPHSKQLQADVERLDSGAGRTGEATLVVLYEDGFIPQRRAFNLNFPDFHNNKIYSIAFPYYSAEGWYRPMPLTIGLQDGQSATTEMIADFGAMAVKALKDKIPQLLVRQVLRARVKYEMQSKAQESGSFAAFATTLYNVVSEQADLRSWLTLPNNAQVQRLQTTAGEQQLQLSTAAGSLTLNLELAAGSTTVLRVFNFNNRLDTQVFQL